jgi:nickel/cobalt transporter (NiCoT) family protein
MTLVDSLDSILMLYSYSGFPEEGWAIFERPSGVRTLDLEERTIEENLPERSTAVDGMSTTLLPDSTGGLQNAPVEVAGDGKMKRDLRVKNNMMSSLSIVLTLMSILVAFRYVIYRIGAIMCC